MTIGTISDPPSAGPGRLGTAPAATVLTYDGRTGELFRLWFKIFLLNLVTIGFYRFWGRTRIRKYLWNHVNLLGDRFEYDGTGGELFLRFLVAIVILVPLFLAVQLAPLFGLGAAWAIVIQVLAVGLLVCLSFVAYYGARRYRLSRTVWRGMRGGLDGSASGFALRVIGLGVLVPLTLSLYTPWWLVRQWNYLINHAGFGNEPFRSSAVGGQLFRPFLAALLASLVMLAVVGGLVVALVIADWSAVERIEQHEPGAEQELIGLAVPALAAYVFLLVANLACYVYFYARTLSYMTSSISLRNVQLSAEIRAWPLFRLQFGNLLILLLTVGLGTPFAAQRYLRFLCPRLVLHNAADLELLSQDPGRRQRKGGEGLLQLLDTGGLT